MSDRDDMPPPDRVEQPPLTVEGPRYARAAEATAEILNLHIFDPTISKAFLCSRVLFLILDAMYLADEELNERRLTPSKN
jgi:hypothetical protein